MKKWEKGNKPDKYGLYWVTTSVAGTMSAYLANYDELDKKWHMVDRYYARR